MVYIHATFTQVGAVKVSITPAQDNFKVAQFYNKIVNNVSEIEQLLRKKSAFCGDQDSTHLFSNQFPTKILGFFILRKFGFSDCLPELTN